VQTISGTIGVDRLPNRPGANALFGLGGNDVLDGGFDVNPYFGGRLLIGGVPLTDDDLRMAVTAPTGSPTPASLPPRS
jgi:hypothetical protein